MTPRARLSGSERTPPARQSGESAAAPHRPQLSQEAADYIRELIMTGQIQPGQFVGLGQIARDLGVSATPVREGLLALRAEGFVTLEPRRGFLVAPLTADDIRDIFTAQAMLAGELAARASRLLAAAQLDHLAQLQDLLSRAADAGEPARLEAHNHEFHRLINRSAAAPKISWMLAHSTRYVPRRFYATVTGWPEASVRDHSAILAALRTRDPDAAREHMARHVRHAGDLLAEHLTQSRPFDPATAG